MGDEDPLEVTLTVALRIVADAAPLRARCISLKLNVVTVIVFSAAASEGAAAATPDVIATPVMVKHERNNVLMSMDCPLVFR
jgi:hypothetical protein